MALAEALLDSTETYLEFLDLAEEGMGDEGFKALASVVYAGRMQQLEDLDLSRNGGLTDEGITALARAINVRGLPALERLSIVEWSNSPNKVTILEVGAIALALVNQCPRLKRLDLKLSNSKGTYNDMFQGMLRAAGRESGSLVLC